MSELRVGQKLWRVPSDERELRDAREVTVVKVGRKWAEIDYGERVYLETLWVDGRGCSSPARCYLSRDEYERESERGRAWSSLRQWIGRLYRAPDHLTADDIREIEARLFGDE